MMQFTVKRYKIYLILENFKERIGSKTKGSKWQLYGVSSYVYYIAKGAFANNKTITSLTLVTYVEYCVKDYAFYNCSNLKSLYFWCDTLLDNYKAIFNSYSFGNCSSLSSIEIGTHILHTYFNGYAFNGCSALDTVTNNSGNDITYDITGQDELVTAIKK